MANVPTSDTGTATSGNGSEAGVWVIAETDDTPTKLVKIVVTDDDGRYLLPELPDANYDVWVRGYGLVDSPTVTGRPGQELALRAVLAPTPRDAAKIYPANYWYSLIEPPAPDDALPVAGSAGSRDQGRKAARDPNAVRIAQQKKPGRSVLIPLSHYLVLGAILFSIGVVGIFLNRKNLVVLLMAIELLLLAANMNFIAFSHYLGDLAGQVFVFFILTVAAAGSAIGLAILIVVFRSRRTINVQDLNRLQG